MRAKIWITVALPAVLVSGAATMVLGPGERSTTARGAGTVSAAQRFKAAVERFQRVQTDLKTTVEEENKAPDFSRELSVTSRRHDLIAIPIIDPREEELPDVGLLTLEDAETGEMIEIDTANPVVREGFREIALQRAQQLQKIFNREAIDSLRLSTDRPYVADLMVFFKNRTRKRS